MAIAEIRRTFTDLAVCSYSMEVLDEMVKALMNGKVPLKQAIVKMAHSPPTTAAEEEAARAATAALGVGGAGSVGAMTAVGTTRAARALSLLIALWRSAHCVQCGGQAGEPAKALAPWAAKALASPRPGGMRHVAELCGPCAAGSVGQCQTMSPPLGRQCFPYNLSTGSAGSAGGMVGGKCPHETFDCVEAALLGSTASLPLPSAATLSARATLSGGVALPAIRRLNSLCGIGSARRLFQTVVARAPFAAAGTAENPGAAGGAAAARGAGGVGAVGGAEGETAARFAGVSTELDVEAWQEAYCARKCFQEAPVLAAMRLPGGAVCRPCVAGSKGPCQDEDGVCYPFMDYSKRCLEFAHDCSAAQK